MKIRIKHRESEIEIDEESKESTIKFSCNEIIKLIGECAKKIIEIESKHNNTFNNDEQHSN